MNAQTFWLFLSYKFDKNRLWFLSLASRSILKQLQLIYTLQLRNCDYDRRLKSNPDWREASERPQTSQQTLSVLRGCRQTRRFKCHISNTQKKTKQWLKLKNHPRIWRHQSNQLLFQKASVTTRRWRMEDLLQNSSARVHLLYHTLLTIIYIYYIIYIIFTTNSNGFTDFSSCKLFSLQLNSFSKD